MKLAVYLPLILPLLAAVSARRLAEWLPPRSATWLLTGSAVVLAAAVGYSVERWADEQAAAAAGDRTLAARAIATAALAAQAAPGGRPVPAGAIGAVADTAGMRGAGAVPRRVAALLQPPPRPRLLLLAVAVTLVAVSGLSALDAAHSLHSLIEFAQASA
jgi:hypothetical protein